MALKAVVFDVGETLIDETRLWERAADTAGVPRFTLMGVVGGLAARGEHHRRAWELLGVDQPDRDLGVGRLLPGRAAVPGCAPERGVRVGAVGNTLTDAEELLREHVDLVGSSARWGVEKPAPAFFERIVVRVRCRRRRDRVRRRSRRQRHRAGARRGDASRCTCAEARGGTSTSRRRTRSRSTRWTSCPRRSVSDLRVGIGVDAHAFEEGVRLVLGGVAIEHPRGLAGHSDGDVIAHALIDAVLGAAGLGDIGGLFPSGDARWHGADSLDLLRDAYGQVLEAGFTLVNADCVLIGEEPRIAEPPGGDAASSRGALAVEPERVNVRATTTDRLGFTGRGEGLAAEAVALLERT